MSAAVPGVPPGPLSARRLRRARVGAALLFLVNGAVFANLLPRLPEVKDAFGLSNTAFGLVVIAFPLGSILAGTAPAPILRRVGSARAAVLGSIAIAALIAGAGAAGGLGGGLLVLLAYVLPLALAGVLDAVVDTAQNAQALDVQRAMGRSILNTMHALWSLGSVLGGLMGTTALALQVPLPLHLLLSGTLFSVVAVLAGRSTLTAAEAAGVRAHALRSGPETASAPPESEATEAGPVADAPVADAPVTPQPQSPDRPAPAPTARRGHALRASGALLLIAVIAITGVMVEDLGQNWSALYLRQVLDAPLTLAGLGLVALMAAQFIGRLLGDPMIDRLGRAAMARLGGLVIAAGIGLVVLAPAPAVGIAGFFLAGLGSATLVPSAYHAADEVPGLRTGTGLAVVSWLMRGAFLTLSPFIGAVSDVVGLRWAFLAVPVVALIALCAAGALRERAPGRPRH